MNGVPIQEASGNGGGDAPGGFTVDEVISSQGFNQTSYESLSYETSEQKSQTPKTQDLPNTSHVYPTVESSHLC
ncbi:hypothetical protein KP509_1Z325100 [Ceratopteris richardii]|nr:hypothetical protein KP509_1Z325100 [Ceratopteris richardii]